MFSPTRSGFTWLRIPLAVAMVAVFAGGAFAYSSLFTSRCSSCHQNDTPTCVGCHEHRGSLSAFADQDSYSPGEIVTITLNGGSRGGWVRGLLYDNQNVEIDRATGPTGTGDDSLGDPVVFPVMLQAPAPLQAGTYVWQAAWFGGATNGLSHLENRTNVTVVVEEMTAVPENDGDPTAAAGTWSSIKALYR